MLLKYPRSRSGFAGTCSRPLLHGGVPQKVVIENNHFEQTRGIDLIADNTLLDLEARVLIAPAKLKPMISTKRLTLRLMSERFMQACLEKRVLEAERLLGANLSPEWFEEMGFLALRVKQLREDPEYVIWGPRAVVLEGEQRVIGHIGFHGKPNQPYLLEFVPDGIEFGYTIDEAYQRQGFAFEASVGLMRWAVLEQGIKRFVLSVSPGNAASQGLAAKLGFKKVGEHIDVEDGLEEVFGLTGDVLAKWFEVNV